MLALYFQQFATRGQKIDLLGFLVELLGKQRDRLDHVLTAIENDKKLSRTNEVDQFQAGRADRNTTPCGAILTYGRMITRAANSAQASVNILI